MNPKDFPRDPYAPLDPGFVRKVAEANERVRKQRDRLPPPGWDPDLDALTELAAELQCAADYISGEIDDLERRLDERERARAINRGRAE